MIPLPYRIVGSLALVIAIGVGVFAWRDHVYQSGRRDALAEVAKQTALAAAERKGRTAVAETSNDQELAALRAYRDAHPEQPVRLCLDTRLPATPAAPRLPGTPAGDVLPLPAGNPGGGERRAGPDIFGLLDLLAARGDQVSAQLRKRQAIDP
jgi:hypothetical protein